jgi:glycosyltransferase involved in cell wall biosynthesis
MPAATQSGRPPMSQPTTGLLVSVIVPAFNAAQFLGDAVRSVLRQTWTAFELIIIDDGSTDDTGDIADRFASDDTRIAVIHQPNRGLSAARNAGMETSTGEVICFLDSDDMFLPGKLQKQVEFLELFPTCDLVFSDYYVGDGSLTPTWFESVQLPQMSVRDALIYAFGFPPMSPLLRRRLVEATGLFDVSLTASEDWDYWIRASRHGQFCYLPGPVGVYRIHSEQMHNDRDRMRANQLKVVEKNFSVGSREWRIGRASMAWAEARQAWVDRRIAAVPLRVVESVRFAASWSLVRDVWRLSRYG